MDINIYYKNLSKDSRKNFAERANTSPEYIEIHLLPRRKTPRKKTMQALAAASEGACTYKEVVAYFLFADAP